MHKTSKKRMRLDELLVRQGIAETRSKARGMILAGEVLVDDSPVTKAGTQVTHHAAIRIRNKKRYVSRGGDKLAGALDCLGLDVTGKRILDIGASTGGFVDCLLSRGAHEVVACDVGYGQLAWKLQCDSRVHMMERTNARNLTADQLPWSPDLITCDVSFISLRLLLEPIKTILPARALALLMVKPQFEVGRELVGKGGVVRERELRVKAVHDIVEAYVDGGFVPRGIASSLVHGPAGNRECFVLLEAPGEQTRCGGHVGEEIWQSWLENVQ